MASLKAALRKARDMRRLSSAPLQEPLRIILHDGRFQLAETIVIRPEDTGAEASPLQILAAPGAKPFISGGINISGWKAVATTPKGIPTHATGQLWMADIPTDASNITAIRQLWINGRKAIRARHRDADSMDRILRWDKSNGTCI